MTGFADPEWARQPLFDPATLETLAQDTGSDVVGMLVEEFLCEMLKRVATITTATGDDLAGIGFEGHALKSICSTYGAARMGRRAAVIERAARDGDRALALAALDGIEAEAQATVAAFRESFG